MSFLKTIKATNFDEAEVSKATPDRLISEPTRSTILGATKFVQAFGKRRLA